MSSFDGGTWALIGQGTSGAASLSSSLHAAEALRAQGRYEKTVHGENAKLAKIQSRYALKRGEEAVQERRLEGHMLESRQRAAAAGQGIDVNQGVALDLQADAAADTASDAVSIRHAAEQEAFGYDVQEANYRAAGKAAEIQGRYGARQTGATGTIQMGRDLLHGAALYGLYRKFPDPPKTKYVEPPAGKNMSDPRNR